MRLQALGATNRAFRALWQHRRFRFTKELVGYHLPDWWSRREWLMTLAASKLAQRVTWAVSQLSEQQHRFSGTLILTDTQLKYICRLDWKDRPALGDHLGQKLAEAVAQVHATTGKVVSLSAAPYHASDLSAAEMEALENVLSRLPYSFRWRDEIEPSFEATCWVAGRHGSRRPLFWHVHPEHVYRGILDQ